MTPIERLRSRAKCARAQGKVRVDVRVSDLEVLLVLADRRWPRGRVVDAEALLNQLEDDIASLLEPGGRS